MSIAPKSNPAGSPRAVTSWRAAWNRLWGNDIFISYSSHDRACGEAIEKLLRLGRYRVFRDDTQLNTGEHLERLLSEVRHTTMLLVLVSAQAMESDWVYRELEEYLDRPRKRLRLAPVFLDSRYPMELPERFRILGDFHGVRIRVEMPVAQLETDQRLLAELTSQFNALRKAALQRWATAAIVVVVACAIGWLIRTDRRNTARGELLRRAEIARGEMRFDLAEAAFARAWLLDPQSSTLAAYRDARARRVFERPARLAVSRDEAVVAVDAAGDEPYAVLHGSNGDAALSVIRRGQRIVLSSPCSSTPLVATRGPLAVWVCGKRLSVTLVDGAQPRSVDLPAEPIRIFLTNGKVHLLFRQGAAAQVAVFTLQDLKPIDLRLLRGAPAGGEMDFCPDTPLIWSFTVTDGRIVLYRWNSTGEPAERVQFTVPDSVGRGELRASWISRVIPAPDCGRFFVEYAPFTLAAQSTFEMLRIRPDSPRPIDRFDSSIEELVPASDESGIEAIYRTSSKELRAFLLTSPVVLTTRVRTLASDVERLAKWPGEVGPPGRTIALDRQFVSIWQGQQLWSRYPVGVGEPVRAVPSRDGRWVAIDGEQGTLLWRYANPWKGTRPPGPELIEAETGIPR